MNKTIKNKVIKYKKIKDSKVVIGILLPPYLSNTNTNIKAYLDPTYVKWLSRANAAVIPIMYNLNKKDLLVYLSQINGILLPGGGIDNKKTHSRKQFLIYQNTLDYIIKYIKKQNDKGNYYPIWATCMSFQLLAILEANGKQKHRNDINLDSIPKFGLDKLYIKKNLSHGKLNNLFTKKQKSLLKNKHSTYHKHKSSFYLDNEIIVKLKDKINIIAINKDEKKRDYLSVYEYKKYPFYAVLFHPEYPLINKKRMDYNIKKKETMLLSDTFGKFFINECKKNKNIIKTIGNKSINRFPLYEFTYKNKHKRVYYFKN